MEYLQCVCDIIKNFALFLKENSEWLCAIALSVFAYMQYRIILKQKNLALLDRRLELKNNFENYVDDRLKNYLEPKLNIDAFKENYENLTKMAEDVLIKHGITREVVVFNQPKTNHQLEKYRSTGWLCHNFLH